MRRSRRPTEDLFRQRTPDRRAGGVRLLAGIAAVAVLLPLIFVGGEYLQRQLAYRAARAGDATLKPASMLRPLRDLLLNLRYELPFPGRKERLLESGLPVYDLRIARKNLALLQQTAERVTARSSPGEVIPREWLPARFRAGGEWVRVEVKLRGEYAYHYLRKRPSLRVEFPKKQLFEGKRRINLVEPYDKGLAGDLATNWELGQHGIMSLDTRFVVVRLNGEVLGLYQEIEHFGRSLADRNGRSEGYIFSGQGQFFGNPGLGFEHARRAADRVAGCYPAPGAPMPSHCSSWAFVRDHFDTDRWAWATALMALLKSKHGWAPDNLRLFWDPARGRFEPIPWDYGYYRLDPAKDPEGEAKPAGYLGEPMLAIPEFRRMRDRRLWSLLNQRTEPMLDYATARLDDLRPALEADIRHLRLKTDLQAHEEYLGLVRSNRDFLMELFQHHELRARLWRTPTGVVGELRNHGKAFLELRGVRVAEAGTERLLPLEAPVVVDGLWQGEPGVAVLQAALPDGARVVGLELANAVTGAPLLAGEIAIEPGQGEAPRLAVTPSQPLRIAVDGIRVDPGRVHFGPGRVRLDTSLSIPPGHEVVFAPGLELEMGQGASLFVYGDLSARGTAARPIRVSGHPEWGAVIVQGTRSQPAQVNIEHLQMAGGTGGENERSVFTGSLSVHDGEVVLRSSEFRDGRAIDGINLKYAKVELRDNFFARTADDSLDCDFCIGEISGNRVVDSGGDALDFSGSDLLVRDNTVERCADKGMSIGERTVAVLEDNRVTSCRTGIAVKDHSDATIRRAQLRELEVGVALYVKKLTFGPSSARMQDVAMEDVASRVLRDSRCSLEILPAAGPTASRPEPAQRWASSR